MNKKAWKAAMDIYRDEEKARDFMELRHPLLDNQRPCDVDPEIVIRLLGRAAYGGGA